jgi:hypothetical protein
LIQKFRYEVVTKATATLAWEVFSNLRRWHTFSNVYGSLEWTHGSPWTQGSRLRIEIVQPVHMFVEHLITHCDPAKKVGWIDNTFGIVLEQWVTFQSLANGHTRVTLQGEMVGGESVDVSGQTAWSLVEGFTHTWYDNFRTVCDQLSPITI